MENWQFSEVMKRGGLWGFFETHKPTGRERFVSFNLNTKRDTIARRAEYIESGRK